MNGNHSTIGGEMCLFFRMGMYLFSFREMVGGANFFFVHKQTNDNLKKKTTQIKAQKSEKVIHHRYDLRGEGRKTKPNFLLKIHSNNF